MGPWDLSAALHQHSASPHPSRHRPRTLPSPSAQAARLGLRSLALTASGQARPGASVSCSCAPLIPASSHSVVQRPDCVHPCPTCSQESGRDPQLVNQSPQAGWLPRCAGSSERQTETSVGLGSEAQGKRPEEKTRASNIHESWSWRDRCQAGCRDRQTQRGRLQSETVRDSWGETHRASQSRGRLRDEGRHKTERGAEIRMRKDAKTENTDT